MGKASSGKKVARAAATGGGARTGRGAGGGPWKWYAIVALVAVLGVFLIVASRGERQQEISKIGPPRPGDHWHVAYGINVCGAFQPELNVERDPQGIHTHAPNGQGDGIIHIHPFTSQAAGDNATLGKFADAAGLKLEDGKMTLPDGDVYADGEKECGGTAGYLRVKYDDEIITENIRDIRFKEDRGRLTIFYGPRNAEIPDPPSVPNLDNLSDVPPEDQGAVPLDPTTESTGATDSTAPGTETSAPADGTATTTPAGSPPPEGSTPPSSPATSSP
jgi:hypothetical protein